MALGRAARVRAAQPRPGRGNGRSGRRSGRGPSLDEELLELLELAGDPGADEADDELLAEGDGLGDALGEPAEVGDDDVGVETLAGPSPLAPGKSGSAGPRVGRPGPGEVVASPVTEPMASEAAPGPPVAVEPRPEGAGEATSPPTVIRSIAAAMPMAAAMPAAATAPAGRR